MSDDDEEEILARWAGKPRGGHDPRPAGPGWENDWPVGPSAWAHSTMLRTGGLRCRPHSEIRTPGLPAWPAKLRQSPLLPHVGVFARNLALRKADTAPLSVWSKGTSRSPWQGSRPREGLSIAGNVIGVPHHQRASRTNLAGAFDYVSGMPQRSTGYPRRPSPSLGSTRKGLAIRLLRGTTSGRSLRTVASTAPNARQPPRTTGRGRVGSIVGNQHYNDVVDSQSIRHVSTASRAHIPGNQPFHWSAPRLGQPMEFFHRVVG